MKAHSISFLVGFFLIPFFGQAQKIKISKEPDWVKSVEIPKNSQVAKGDIILIFV